MVCNVQFIWLCAATLPVLTTANSDDFEMLDECFFDSVSTMALSLLQKSVTFVGVPNTIGDVNVAASMPAAPLLRSMVVPLKKVAVQQRAAGFFSFFSEGLSRTSFYVGKVSIGNPAQSLEVIFDTSSLFSWVRHDVCMSKACKSHRRYSTRKSSTAVDVDHTGVALSKEHRLVDNKAAHEEVEVHYTQSDLGEGNMSARFVLDTLCLGQASEGAACVDMVLATAVKLDDEPFSSMPGDGIIGLSLEGQGTSPMNSFLGRVFEASGNVPPQFGIWLGKDGGEVHLGGHELADLASPLVWFPVHQPEDGYWQVAIQSVRVGDATVNDCSNGCHAIVDTGVSHLGVMASLLPSLKAQLVPVRAADGTCSGPELAFDFGNMTLTLPASDYAGDDCVPLLGSLDLEEDHYNGVFTFGATVLQRYYAAFDWEHKRLGFALLSDSPIPAGQDAPRSMRGALIV